MVSLDVRYDNAMRFIVQFPNGKQRGVIVPIELEANYFAAEKAVEEWAAHAWAGMVEETRRQAELAQHRAEREAADVRAREDARLFQERASAPPIDYAARNARIVVRRYEGHTFRAIAAEFDMTPGRVRQIVIVDARKKRKATEKWHADRANLGRPIDMGGKRDVWQEFTPETAFA